MPSGNPFYFPELTDFDESGVLMSMKNRKSKGITLWKLLLTAAGLTVILFSGGIKTGSGQNSVSMAQLQEEEETGLKTEDSKTASWSELELLDLKINRVNRKYQACLARRDAAASDLQSLEQKEDRYQNWCSELLERVSGQILMLKVMECLNRLEQQAEETLQEASSLKNRVNELTLIIHEQENRLDSLLSERNTLWQKTLTEQHERTDTEFREGGKHDFSALIGRQSLWAKEGELENSGGLSDRQDEKKACLPYALEEIGDHTSLSASEDWMVPAVGSLSAGTWAYPSGDLHLGMDLAVPLFTALKAPADGLILYADAPVSSTGGYPGNWSGWPQGGGNTIAMAVNVKGRLYAVTFAHLSSSIQVRPGQIVKQGDLIAKSGNSGNSTGPHTHIEVFEIHVSLQELVSFFSRNPDFSFGCGFASPGSSSIGTRIRPEEIFYS